MPKALAAVLTMPRKGRGIDGNRRGQARGPALGTENEQLPVAFGQALGSRRVLLRAADGPGLLLVQRASQARARASQGRAEAAHGPEGSPQMSFEYAPQGSWSSRDKSGRTMAPVPAPRQVHENYLRVLNAAAEVLDGSATALEPRHSKRRDAPLRPRL